jgi:hypothetical protein
MTNVRLKGAVVELKFVKCFEYPLWVDKRPLESESHSTSRQVLKITPLYRARPEDHAPQCLAKDI